MTATVRGQVFRTERVRAPIVTVRCTAACREAESDRRLCRCACRGELHGRDRATAEFSSVVDLTSESAW